MKASCGKDLYWRGCYSGSYDLIAPESYAHPAKMSVALCYRILDHLKELNLLKDNDTILDPMAGTGITAICAGAKGYKAITTELEEKFIGFQQKNKDYASRKLYQDLDWTILRGDARRLSELLNEKKFVTVSSPPYGIDMKLGGGIDWAKANRPDRRIEINPKTGKAYTRHNVYGVNTGGYGEAQDNIGNLPDRPLKSVMSPPYADAEKRDRSIEPSGQADNFPRGDKNISAGYQATKDNIGVLPDKPLKTLTSPPYESSTAADYTLAPTKGSFSDIKLPALNSNYGDTEGQIGQEKQSSYLEAMLQVYQEIAKVSDVLAIVLKNPTRNGKLRRLDLDTIKLLEMSGWTIHCRHHALLFEETEQTDLFGETKKKVKGRLSFFKRLSWQAGNPVAAWEDIIIAVRG